MRKIAVLFLAVLMIFVSVGCGADSETSKISRVSVYNDTKVFHPVYLYEIRYVESEQNNLFFKDEDLAVLRKYIDKSGYILSTSKHEKTMEIDSTDFFCNTIKYNSVTQIPIKVKIIKRIDYSIDIQTKADTYIITHYTYPESLYNYQYRKNPLVKTDKKELEESIEKHIVEEAKTNVSIEYYS